MRSRSLSSRTLSKETLRAGADPKLKGGKDEPRRPG